MQNDPFSELANEDNAFVKMEPMAIEEELPFNMNIKPSATEESSYRRVEEIDHEMLDNAMQFECVSLLESELSQHKVHLYFLLATYNIR